MKKNVVPVTKQGDGESKGGRVTEREETDCEQTEHEAVSVLHLLCKALSYSQMSPPSPTPTQHPSHTHTHTHLLPHGLA